MVDTPTIIYNIFYVFISILFINSKMLGWDIRFVKSKLFCILVDIIYNQTTYFHSPIFFGNKYN